MKNLIGFTNILTRSSSGAKTVFYYYFYILYRSLAEFTGDR
ncbi:MAG: hypothetical protein ACTTHU_01200 [Treponema sp.]